MSDEPEPLTMEEDFRVMIMEKEVRGRVSEEAVETFCHRWDISLEDFIEVLMNLYQEG